MSNNTQQEANKKEFKPFEGEYVVTLDDAKQEAFKNGSGTKMVLKFKVAKGDLKDRVIFHDLPIEHSSKNYRLSGEKGADLLFKALGLENGLTQAGDDIASLVDYIGDQVVAVTYIEKGTAYTKDGVEKLGKDRTRIRMFKTR